MDIKKSCNGCNYNHNKCIQMKTESPIKQDVQINFVEKDDISVLSKTLLRTNKKDNQSTERINNPQLNVKRLAYNLSQFNEKYEVVKNVKKGSASCKTFEWFKQHCSSQSLSNRLNKFFPIFGWLSDYRVKDNLIPDIIAGLTILIFQVPQSMGYSLIARVPPVYGLYSSLFPALVYAILGTSRHCAIGTFAIVSLMTGSQISHVFQHKGDIIKQDVTSIEITMVISFLIGIYQLLFGILRLGFFSVYMSEQLVSGFTTACAVYVLTSQISYLVGIHLPSRSGPLSLINSYRDLIVHYNSFNTSTLMLSIICCLVVIVFKFLINPFIQKKTKINIPFPIELILVIFGTLTSHLLDMESRWNIQVVGAIPKGIPKPSLPRFSLFKILAIPSIPLAIVAYTLTISVGKIFATKHNYKVDSNQELVALGATNLISSFFKCIPSAASLSRSAIQESSGGRTQMVSIVNCIGLVFVLLFAGPLLSKLPNCILASIIVIALKSLLFQVKDLALYWRLSKLDGSIWLITFFAVIILDVDYGLYVSLAYSLLTLIYKSQRPKIYLLGCVNNTDVYVPLHKYVAANEIDGIKIYQFCGPLHFANIEYFRKGLIRKTGVNVKEILMELEKQKKVSKHKSKENKIENDSSIKSPIATFCWSVSPPSHIIIDCSMFSYIDAAGVRQLKKTISEYENIGIKTFLACVATHVHRMLEKDGFFIDIPLNHVYITIHDAVHHVLGGKEQEKKVRPVSSHSNIIDISSSSIISSMNEDI